MDEVYSLLSIKGMAEEVGMLAPLYRSRKLHIFIVLQALSQLAKELRQQIWTIGNVVSFGVSNFDEAYDISQQLFKYQGDLIRRAAPSDSSHPILEQDRGQYLNIANKIQRLAHRECFIRRYVSERELEKNVTYVKRTSEIPTNSNERGLKLKDYLLKKRGVKVEEALEEIRTRTLKKEKTRKHLS